MQKEQKLVLIVAILASFVAFLDGSVVNVALPAIARQLGGGLVTQQWVTDAYMVTLGSLMLVAGSLSDLLGRQRILRLGLIGFLVTSMLCAIAPTATVLIVSRALQGVAGALLVPSSLALIMAAFSGKAQGLAIGRWTAWTGIAFVIGPLVGGVLVDDLSWRFIFAINALPVALTLWLMTRLHQADTRAQRVRIDSIGAVLCTVALASLSYGLIEQSQYGWSSPLIYGSLVVGTVLFAAFLIYEKDAQAPMLPLALFRIRNFYVGNIATVAIYAGLTVSTFLIVIFLQQVSGYSAVSAGLATLPVTIVMFFLSSRFGKLAETYGPRRFMTIGPLLAAVGFALMLRLSSPVHYWLDFFPAITVFALGLSITVAPLTSAVLGSIDTQRSGIASAVNNAISRIAGLVAIAMIGLVTGSQLTVASFHKSLLVMIGLLVIGGVVSYLGIRTVPDESEPS